LKRKISNNRITEVFAKIKGDTAEIGKGYDELDEAEFL